MNLKDKYTKEIAPSLKEKLGYKSVMEVPRLKKITINMGVGEASNDKGVLENAVRDLESIAGQKPVVTKARKAVSSFKIREQYPIGCKVTLRGNKMYDFFERLINLAIPREKDFRGLNPKSFDGQGNYNLGIKEQIIFPEIDYDKVDKLRGMDIAITTSAKRVTPMLNSFLQNLIFHLEVEMARKSIVEREKLKLKLVAKYAVKRQALKDAQKKATTFEEIMEVQRQLQKLPRRSNPNRVVRRCSLTGRPKGVYRKFGLSRSKLRELAMSGKLPGVKKSSW